MSWFFTWFLTMNIWKFVGLLGQMVFGSRFFVQWIATERMKRSVIPLAFWHLSLTGGVLTFRLRHLYSRTGVHHCPAWGDRHL